MALKVSELSGNRTATATVEYAGETVELTYHPDRMTPAREEAFQEDVETAGGVEALLALLSELVADWDVVGDDGEPFPPTADNMRHLPSQFLVAVLSATRQELEGEAKPSVAGPRRGAAGSRTTAGAHRPGGQ